MLEIENLKISFTDTVVVNELNLTVEEKSFTALVGRSGSGKSVTTLSICRLVRSASVQGAVRFRLGDEAKNLLALSEKELQKIRGRQIGYVFQDPASSLNPVRRIGSQVTETYLAHFEASEWEATQKGKQLFESVKIADVERVWRAFPHELSGGLKQRVMIAMALILEPRLLIADEPTTALDVTTAAEIMKLFAAVQKERALSILFITHDLPLARVFSERIYVMEKGKAIECLEKKAGWAMKEDYTRKLFSASLLSLSSPKSFIGDPGPGFPLFRQTTLDGSVLRRTRE